MNSWIGRFLIGLAAALWVPCAYAQGAALPDTQPGHRVGELLKLCEAPQAEQITQWLKDHISAQIAAHANLGFVGQDLARRCQVNGGFDFQAITTSNATTLTFDITARKIPVSYRWLLATTANGKIVGLPAPQPTPPPEASLPKDLSDAAIARDLRQRVSQLSAAGLFSGIVVVARGQHPIASISAGFADRSKRTPITGRSQFTLGSMGKMFTAAGIGQLVDAHRIAYTDPVGKFFPDYPDKTIREKATVGMLLSHTAGLGDFLAKRTPQMMKNGVQRAAELMPLYDTDPPRFPPGTSWAYSNAGLALAGAILEKVSGEDYPDYIRKHIFGPAHMTDSDPNNIPLHFPRQVTAYTQAPSGQWQEAPRDIGSPAGGDVSSANDLIRFADALRSGKLVSRETFAQMATPHGPAARAGYGYAMQIENVDGSTVVGHAGGFPGVSTHLYIFRDAPYTIVVLANQDPPAEGYVGEEAVALVAEKVKTEHAPAAASREPR